MVCKTWILAPVWCFAKYYMRFDEIAPTKPRTPQQARLDALKTQKDNVGKALDTERKRQKVAKAQQNLTKALSV